MTEHVIARFGFFPLVTADHVTITQANSSMAVARGDLDIQQAGASVIAAGGNAKVRQGGAALMAAGGDVSVKEGGALVVAAGSVDVARGFVGLALGRQVTLTDSRVLLGSAQAAVLGAVLGLVVLAGKLLARRR